MNEQLMMLLSQLTGGGSKGMVRDVGESKSIDDIINQSDMFEFLSKAMADKTNIDVSQMPMNPDRLRYSSDTIIDFLNSMGGYEMPTDEERRRTLPKRRKDLVKPKTKQG